MSSSSSAVTSSMECKRFWERYRGQPDQRAMMLNQNAELIADADRDDILDVLPDISGKRLLELGAGIGRFTGKLAEKAASVHATDFIDAFIDTNRNAHSHMGNVDFCCSDASRLSFSPEKFDLIFTNWLLMYLSDLEVVDFMQKCLAWLCNNDSGYVHVRESCSEPSSKKKGTTCHQDGEENPTSYRFSSVYVRCFSGVRFTDDNGNVYGFKVLWAKSVPTYVEVYQNWRQVHFLLKKVRLTSATSTAVTPQTSLADANKIVQKMQNEWAKDQATVDGIYEKMKSELESSKMLMSPIDTMVIAKLKSWMDVEKLSESRVLVVNWSSNHFIRVNAHQLAASVGCARVWCVEANDCVYRVDLTEANDRRNTAMRFAWIAAGETDKECWSPVVTSGPFSAVVACVNSESDLEQMYGVVSELKAAGETSDCRVFVIVGSTVAENGHKVVVNQVAEKFAGLVNVTRSKTELDTRVEINGLAPLCFNGEVSPQTVHLSLLEATIP